MAMEDLEFIEPSLDLSCGHGIFSFLQAGGDFDLSFDQFTAVRDLDRFSENVDIYDAPPGENGPKITAFPKYKITVGTDWKQNLLDRASQLDFYRELRCHDNNYPLPFADNSFATIFSNSVYWVEDPGKLLWEISRVLQPMGQAILTFVTTAIHDYTLDRYEWALGSDWLALIDRGRKANYPRLYDDAGWERLMKQAGLKIISKRPVNTWLQSHIADIGLRPISPLLIEMANDLTPEKRMDIKRRWIDLWERLLLPFCEVGFDLGVKRPEMEIIYVLRNRLP